MLLKLVLLIYLKGYGLTMEINLHPPESLLGNKIIGVKSICETNRKMFI